MATTTKKDLIDRIAAETNQKRIVVKKTVQCFLNKVIDELRRGNRLEFRDFGVFEVKTRASRIGRNPRTGDQVPVPERRVVTFRPGKKMKEIVSRSTPAEPAKPESQPPPAPPGEPQPGPGYGQQ